MSDEPMEPKLISQNDLNDLCRNLELTEDKCQLLGSRLKQWNLLQADIRTSFLKYRENEFSELSSENDNLYHCNDISGLMEALRIEYKLENWRLCIYSSKSGLKVVLPHNGNEYPSVPVAYWRIMRETYENMKIVLQKMKYSEHNWYICSDLKVVALLSELQLSFTKQSFFLCECDSRARNLHYVKKDWLVRNAMK